MSVLSRILLSASRQFVAAAPVSILSPQARLITTASLLALSALGAAPASAQTYAWGNGGGDRSGNSSVLPEQSAGRWGEVVGGVLGRAAGALASGTDATTEVGRRLQAVSAGVGEEVGRNLGRVTAKQPYAFDDRAGATSPAAVAAALNAMPLIERDHLDTMGVNAILSYGPAAAVSSQSSAYRDIQVSHQAAVRQFELSLRAVADRGFSIAPWADARAALLQPLRTVPEARYVQYAQEMTQRLRRPGGPGYTVSQQYLQAQQQAVGPQGGYQPAPPQYYGNQVYPLQRPVQPQVYQAQPQVYQAQIYHQTAQIPRPNSLEAMRASMNGMLVPLTSSDRP